MVLRNTKREPNPVAYFTKNPYYVMGFESILAIGSTKRGGGFEKPK